MMEKTIVTNPLFFGCHLVEAELKLISPCPPIICLFYCFTSPMSLLVSNHGIPGDLARGEWLSRLGDGLTVDGLSVDGLSLDLIARIPFFLLLFTRISPIGGLTWICST